MPAYDVEPYVGDAIRSVLAQSLGDLEVIVVDDGSRDGTAEVASAIAGEDPRVRLVRQANRGLAGARNTALRMARADVLALLDSDDLWEPDFLAEQMGDPRGTPRGGHRHRQRLDVRRIAARRARASLSDPRPDPDLAAILGDERAVFIMSVFRRRVYEVVGCFDETMRTNEDYDFWLRAALAGFRFTRNDRPLGHYRIRTDSLSASEMRMLRGILRVYAKDAALRRGSARARSPSSTRRRSGSRPSGTPPRRGSRWRAPTFPPRSSISGSCTPGAAARRSPSPGCFARWAPGMLARVYGFRRSRTPEVSAGPMLP
jgi:glycosyltransferase involved in cell wall biosynthesis